VTRTVGRWIVERHESTVASIHSLELPVPPAPTIWLARPTDSAVALGSAQSDEHLDREVASRLGLDVVRRRSGGGAVLVEPGDLLWVDVVVPAGDRLWEDDIGAAFLWLGEVWGSLVRSMGHRATVHTGRHERSQLSDVICFGGLGPGEVTVGGAKVLGMSQRRTRGAARFQCALALEWRPSPLIEVFGSVDIEGFAELVTAAGRGLGCRPEEAEELFLDLMSRLP
jgi:lipoate-protein ligase A